VPEISSQIRKLEDILNTGTTPWRYRADSLLEHVIRTQHTASKRNTTPRHFWRFRGDNSGVVEVFRETSALKKRYDAPVSVLFHVNYGAPSKPLKSTLVDEQHNPSFRVDLAECIRLGEIFGVVDELLGFYFYLPKSDDLFQWNYSIYKIGDIRGAGNGYYEPIQRFVVWEGSAALLRGDSTDPTRPMSAQIPAPLVEAPVWP